MILQKISDLALIARKNKSVDAITLTTLLAEVKRVGFDDGKRETSNSEAIDVINKFIKNAKANIDILSKQSKDVSIFQREVELYQSFLPNQVSEDELKAIATQLKSGGSNVGQFIKHIKSTLAVGTYDPASLKGIFDNV